MSWKKNKSRHHRLARANGGRSGSDNISIVSVSAHRAFHQLFGIMSPEEIAKVLTDVWIPSNYKMIAVKK